MLSSIKSLRNNLRFYILATSFFASIALFCWLRIETTTSQLLFIRSEQLFGYIAIGLWYIALLISPLSKTIGAHSGPMPQLLYSRRAIGVSAAYFAVLHGSIALWGQLGGLGNLALLPDRFDWALSLGLLSLVVLAMMAATSFDTVIRFMTFKRWKMLHRLGYVGGIAVLLHLWLIGTHATYPAVRWTLAIAVILLAGLELWRITLLLGQKYPAVQKLIIKLGEKLKAALLIASVLVPILAHGTASAHVVVQDESRQTGAILHIGPNDDPVAGEPSDIHFYIQDVDVSNFNSTLQIEDDTGKTVMLPGENTSGTITVPYTFKKVGAYTLTLAMQPTGQFAAYEQPYTFRAVQRVERGSQTMSLPAPQWAIAGLVASTTGFFVLCIIAATRWRTIIKQAHL